MGVALFVSVDASIAALFLEALSTAMVIAARLSTVAFFLRIFYAVSASFFAAVSTAAVPTLDVAIIAFFVLGLETVATTVLPACVLLLGASPARRAAYAGPAAHRRRGLESTRATVCHHHH